MILMPVVGHGVASGSVKLERVDFPKTIKDVPVDQRVKNQTAGYAVVKDAVTYVPIKIELEIDDSQSLEDELSNSDPADVTGGAETENSSDTNVVASDDESAQNQSQNSGVRSVCFTRDTKNPKRFIPPTAVDGIVYWWVGDSRFTGMFINGVIGRQPNEAVVAQAGKGLEWFTTSPRPTGRSLLDSCLRAGDVVILNLGANDIWKYDNYISTYKDLMSAYPNVIFKIVSVNPVYDGRARLKNAKIETFNNQLRTAFPHNYVDTYSIVQPYVTADTTDSEGLHYRGGGIEQKIYDTVMQSVQ